MPKAIGYKDGGDGTFGFKFTDDGQVKLGNTNDDVVQITGSIIIDRATESSLPPAIQVNSGDYNHPIIRTNYAENSGHLGWSIRYMGAGSGDANRFALTMDGGTGTDVDAILVDQDGDTTFGADVNVSTHDGSSNGFKLGGTLVTATAAHLNHVAGVTSNIQTQLDGKLATGGTATLATNVTVSANNTNNETVYPVFVDAATGTQGLESDTGLTYNPSSGVLTATSFIGNGAGLTNIPVDDTTIDLNVATLRVKDSGISTNKIADDAITAAKIDSSITPRFAKIELGSRSIEGNEHLSIAAGVDYENTFVILGADTDGAYLALGIKSGTPCVTGGHVGTNPGGNASLAFRTSPAGSGENEQMRIDHNGNVMVNATSHAGFGRLEIKQSANTSPHGLAVINTTAGRSVRVYADGSDNAIIDSGANGAGQLLLNTGAGKVGIGKGSATTYGQLEVYANSSTTAANITVHQDHGDGDSRLHLRSGGNDWYMINDGDSDSLVFNNEGTERMSLSNGGNLTVTGDLFVNDYARIDALRVGTTSTDPGDGNLVVEGALTAATLDGGAGDLTLTGPGSVKVYIDDNDSSGGSNYFKIYGTSDVEHYSMRASDGIGGFSSRQGFGVTSPLNTGTNDGIHIYSTANIGASTMANSPLLIGTSTTDALGLDNNQISKDGGDLYITTVDADDIQIKSNDNKVAIFSSLGEFFLYNANGTSGTYDKDSYWKLVESNSNGNLLFYFKSHSGSEVERGYLRSSTDVNAIDFTGQHRSLPSDSTTHSELSSSIGMIVVSDGTFAGLADADVTINDAIPKVKLSNIQNQKTVFGVISDAEDTSETSRSYVQGIFGSVVGKNDENDHRIIINSLGEGGIWITNINGNIENGDYITTCEIPGYGMKQDDDLLHNYTVAKITQDCLFDLNSTTYECEEIQHDNQTYRAAFVGCTYHCG